MTLDSSHWLNGQSTAFSQWPNGQSTSAKAMHPPYEGYYPSTFYGSYSQFPISGVQPQIQQENHNYMVGNQNRNLGYQNNAYPQYQQGSSTSGKVFKFGKDGVYVDGPRRCEWMVNVSLLFLD